MATLDQDTQILGEIETSKLFIEIGGIRILSGAYKLRVVTKGILGGRKLTDQELLQDELNTMESHAHKVHDLYEQLAELRQDRITAAEKSDEEFSRRVREDYRNYP